MMIRSLVSVAVASLACVAGSGQEAVNIGGVRQLFVDDYIVSERENVRLTLHQPAKYPGNPVLLPDKPWEAKSVALYGTVFYDEDDRLFKMWYRAIDDTCYACCATSEDGIHWEKPLLRVKSHKGSTENNIVLGSVSPKFYLDGFAVVKDRREPDPGRRYKMLTYNGERRFAAMVSPDGIHWNGPVNSKEHDTGDVVSMYFDSGLGQYVALLKRRYVYEDGSKVRARLLAFSNDFITWSAPQWALVPDDRDPPSTHYYSHVAYEYEGLRMGYVSVFIKDTELIDTHLCHSRDGRTWHRYRERVPFLPNSEGTFDGGMLLAGAGGLVVRDGKIWIYYSGYGTDHGGRERTEGPVKNGIGLAYLRVDGFVSADGGPAGGTLLTKPLAGEGATLHVNADARDGEVRAEVLDAQGTVLARTRPVVGDALDAAMTWEGAPPAPPAGEAVRLRFHLRDAKLYSFWLTPE